MTIFECLCLFVYTARRQASAQIHVMKIQQKRFSKPRGWEVVRDDRVDPSLCHLVLVFASREILADAAVFNAIKSSYPHAEILLNSTAGEIYDTHVYENTLTLTAIVFEKTSIHSSAIQLEDAGSSFDAGKQLAGGLDPEGLKSVLVIADGRRVNGSELVVGLQKHLPEGTIITGGLAGDGEKFEKTLVGLNEPPLEGRIAAIGFYGRNLFVTYGSISGWDPFGPDRLITRSEGNILYELDGKPALDLYKLYLGEYAQELPRAALLFPLHIRTTGEYNSTVRTVLSVSEENKSLTFAGNVPRGAHARLMKVNMNRLINSASAAAKHSSNDKIIYPELAILISGAGRKLVLDQRVEEEVEAVRETYGSKTALTGFYAYGEIAPSFNFLKCELHNQTMTITTLTEG